MAISLLWPSIVLYNKDCHAEVARERLFVKSELPDSNFKADL